MFSRSRCRSGKPRKLITSFIIVKVFFESASLSQFMVWSSWGMVSSGLSLLQANNDVLIEGILNGILFITCFTNYFKSEVLLLGETHKVS
jgi:hypothetical protein